MSCSPSLFSAGCLISDARRLLGSVLRDVDLLQDLLNELGPRPGFPRGALIVGLGLLGEPMSFKQAVSDGFDYEAATAWGLLAVVAGWKGSEEVLEGARPEASGPAQRVMETARRRVRSGYVVSAVG